MVLGRLAHVASSATRVVLSATCVVAVTLGGVVSASAEEGPASAPAVAEPTPDPGPGPRDPLIGFAGERAFVRSPDNEIVLFPSFRLQVGGAYFPRSDPKSGFSLRRARLELQGWLGPMFYFDVGGDVAATSDLALPPGASSADAYVAFAPAGDLFIAQLGQFDTPFTLENRTLESYTPFIERSLAVRALAAPRNKDLGLMIHGADDARTLYYSAGVFNGDGPGQLNADNQVDVIGRVVVSPLARTSFETLAGLSLGGSIWYGQHLAGAALPTQTTPGGFVVFAPAWTSGQVTPLSLDLDERGRSLAFAGELSLPIGHELGLRAELVYKKQDLAEDHVAADGSTIATLGRANLTGLAGYAEAWVWLEGDDRQLPTPGLQLPTHLARVAAPSTQHGLQLVARAELLKEDLTSTQPTLGDPNLATTRVVEALAGLNYWYGRRVRASFNYVVTVTSGTSENVKTLVTEGWEHEALMLLGMTL
jgi:Phosphate-selective porin O and P